jgi:hypothetical protein
MHRMFDGMSRGLADSAISAIASDPDYRRRVEQQKEDAKKKEAMQKAAINSFSCADVGDTRHFYFVFPADSPTRGHLDINEAVRLDKGKTPVCLIYLTHMLGPDRAEVMMANPKIRDRHLTVVPMPNFQNTGFDTIVLRYTELPAVSGVEQTLANMFTSAGVPLLLTSAAVGGAVLSHNLQNFRKAGDDKKSSIPNLLGGVAGLAAIGIPVASFMSALKVARRDRDRLLELEARRMGTQFQQWQEIAMSQVMPELAPAAVKKSSKQDAVQEAEFRRVMELSPEARVAGGADPKTARIKKGRWPKKEKSTSRSASRRKSARAGNSPRRSRGASRGRARNP